MLCMDHGPQKDCVRSATVLLVKVLRYISEPRKDRVYNQSSQSTTGLLEAFQTWPTFPKRSVVLWIMTLEVAKVHSELAQWAQVRGKQTTARVSDQDLAAVLGHALQSILC